MKTAAAVITVIIQVIVQAGVLVLSVGLTLVSNLALRLQVKSQFHNSFSYKSGSVFASFRVSNALEQE